MEDHVGEFEKVSNYYLQPKRYCMMSDYWTKRTIFFVKDQRAIGHCLYISKNRKEKISLMLLEQADECLQSTESPELNGNLIWFFISVEFPTSHDPAG